MFSNRTPDGRNNIAGVKVAELRKAQGKRFSQRALSDKLRELGYLAKALGTSIACLLGGEYNGAYI